MTPYFFELTSELIQSVGQAYEDLVSAHDADDILMLSDELVQAVKQHVEELEHEIEYPTETSMGGGEFE